MMCCDQGFEYNNPTTICCSLKESIRHLRNIHISFVGGLDQIFQVFLLGPHNLMGGRLAHGSGYCRSGDAVLSSSDAIRQRLARHLVLSAAPPPPVLLLSVLPGAAVRGRTGRCNEGRCSVRYTPLLGLKAPQGPCVPQNLIIPAPTSLLLSRPNPSPSQPVLWARPPPAP